MSTDQNSSDSSEPGTESDIVKAKDKKVWKILVIGEVSVGKTSLIKRYVHNFFSQHYRATIGVDFALKQLVWEDGSLIMLQLWDIAGQERFASMNRVYYKGALGSFVLADSSNPDSFKSAVRWKKDFDTKVTLEDGQPAPAVLLVNKCDLEKVGIASDVVQLHNFAQENGFLTWCYVSAKENVGIEDAAKLLIKKIMERFEGSPLEKTIDQREVKPLQSSNQKKDEVKLTTETSEPQTKNGCSC